MLRTIRTFILLSATSALAALGYYSIGNVLLLLTTAWFAGLALFSTFGPSRFADSLESRMLRRVGFLSTGEVSALMLTMGIFSFVAYFAIQSHWFLLAHGSWWTLASLRGFYRAVA